MAATYAPPADPKAPAAPVGNGTPYAGPPAAGASMPKTVRFKAQVKLKPGQVLHYVQGQGYYAGPPVRTVTPKAPPPGGSGTRTPPVDPYAAQTPAQVDARASSIAQQQITPQEQAIQQQQQKADAAATAQRAEIEAFQLGASKLLGDVAPTVGAGYDAAAGQVGDLARGTSGQVASDLQGAQAQDQAFAESQGQSGGHTIDPQSVGTTLQMQNGVIPGTQLAAEGAAEQARAAEAVQLPIDAGNEEIAKAMSDARAQDDSYAQQLLQIAQQYPGMKAQALQQLNQYELDKANYRRQLHDDNVSNSVNQEQADTQARAERANEKAAGIDAAAKQNEIAYKWASLNLQSQKALDAVKAAQAKGERPSAYLSRVYGHVVDSNGKAILGADGKPIPVMNATGAVTPQQKAVVEKNKALQSATSQSATAAAHVAGKPTDTPSTVLATGRATGKQVGEYIASPTQKYNVPGGVFPPAYPGAPATTNNPARAQRIGGMSLADARVHVYQEIGGDQLVSRFHLTRSQVMRIVNQALAPYYGK